MGIALYQLLAQEFFKDFYVVAGRKGLHREVQGIAVMDSPDAFRWAKGKELSLTSGYALSKEPHCLDNGFHEGTMQQSAGMMIKRKRYLEQIPEHLIELFEEHDIPLISMPFEVPFMDVINQVNVCVMNRTIRRFRIQNDSIFQLPNLTYKERKIKKILQAVEAEMNFPAFLYDVNEEKSYYSSANFRRISENFHLRDEDYWNPSMEYTRHTLCDYIHMTRYRLVSVENQEGPRISWVLIPIAMNGVTQAYFVVMESKEFLDYCDEYSIRIAFLELQSVYEQIMVAQSVGNIGFENFVLYALNYDGRDGDRFMYQANQHGISMTKRYICLMFTQVNDTETSAREERKHFVSAFQKSSISRYGKMAFLDENKGIILLGTQEKQTLDFEALKKLLEELRINIREKCSDMELAFAITREENSLTKLRESVQKCQKVLEMGKRLYPREHIWDYEMLGPYAWIDIPAEELARMLEQYQALMQEEKNREMLKTLKLYLENNMNYSVTAEKMYVHINTVRKRIEKAKEILDVSLEERLPRLKIEMLLQFLEL